MTKYIETDVKFQKLVYGNTADMRPSFPDWNSSGHWHGFTLTISPNCIAATAAVAIKFYALQRSTANAGNSHYQNHL